MSTRGKILSAVAVIFFVCLVVWVVRTTPKDPPPMEKIEPPTVMEYEGNTITEEKDGKIIWELTCDKMRVDSITQDMELTNVKGKYYDEETIWELTAKRGIYDRTENIIFVEGDVIIKNNEGTELNSEELSWHTEEEMISATGNVSVTKEDGSKILSEELIWFAKEETLTANGNVRVKNDDGAKLFSDKLEWFTAEEKVIATGNVRIYKDDMRGFGDLAYAENDFKKFGLLGHARVLNGVKDDDEEDF
ncbi:MAG: LPS export ABC transporter periplasmic protein LptC [Selenomonadaceae bacterium]|nr:LPS export ABC transporter periplasmic protein LptC [Selenomonadaceae bacterium]